MWGHPVRPRVIPATGGPAASPAQLCTQSSLPAPSQQPPWRPYERETDGESKKGGRDRWGGEEMGRKAGRRQNPGGRGQRGREDFPGTNHFWTPPPTQGSSLPPYQLLALPPGADFSTCPSLPATQDSTSQGFFPRLGSVLRREIVHPEQMASFRKRIKPSFLLRTPRAPPNPHHWVEHSRATQPHLLRSHPYPGDHPEQTLPELHPFDG